MKGTIKVLLIGWLIFSFIIGFGAAKRICADEVVDNAVLFGTVLGLIDRYYVDEIKLRDIVYPAIKEMVNQLDPHSRFLTPEDVKKEKEEEKATREYVGVGMIFGVREDLKSIKKELEESGRDFDVNTLTFEIKKVFDGSPAQRAGLLAKDEIRAIDGVSTKDIGAAEIAKIKKFEKKIAEKFEQIKKRIIGTAGTSVILTIKRAGWSTPKDFIIVRDKIQIKNVERKILESDGKKFGYLKIGSFMPDTTVEEVKKATAEFNKQKVGGVVIDLRNNDGGYLSHCVEVLENFLPPRTLIISEKGKSGEAKVFTRGNYVKYLAAPLVILINEGTASASEIVAGVLRDYKRAVLIGRRTYGKGSVQSVWGFPDGSQLRLTTYKYFLPQGECIHEKGISPHIEIETEFDEPIISEALKVLRNWEAHRKKFLK